MRRIDHDVHDSAALTVTTLWMFSAVAFALGEMTASALGIDVVITGSATKLIWVAGCCAALTAMRPRIGSAPAGKLADILIASSLFAVISMLAALWSYIVAASTHGYRDGWFVAMDRSMGFDWRWLYDLERSSPALMPFVRECYMAFWNMPLIVIVALIASGRGERVVTFLTAHLLALTLTVALFVLFPVRSAIVELLGMTPPYMPFTGVVQVQIIDALRDGSMHTIDLGRLSGIIGFPSYHAAGSILCIWACWPVRLMRWPMLILNAAVIAATPIEGAHYLADIWGGAIVVTIAILAASRWPIRIGADRGQAAALVPAAI